MSTKEKVLELLLKALFSDGDEKIVSGEKLAAECEVSRAAVWKAVNTLRAEGFAIEGTTNGGYCLSDDDIFTKEAFTQIIAQKYPELTGSTIEVFKEIDSTNTYAKRVLSECGSLRNPDGTLTQAGKKYHCAVITAESQTAGRGRLGRTFVSPAKTGVYLSIIYAPEGGITNPAKLTAFTAVAVCRAIKILYGIIPDIKWINDLYLNGKKICGILAEGFTNFETGMIESAVIGIGINIRDNEAFKKADISKIAGAIENNLKTAALYEVSKFSSPDSKCKPEIKKTSRCELAACVASNVIKIMKEPTDSVMKEYKKASFLIGKELTVHPLAGSDKAEYSAVAVDIDDNAALIVELADGTRKALSSGEITLHNTQLN